MAQATSSGTHLEDVESSSEPISSCIKEFMILRESVEKSNKKAQYWTNETSKLVQSNRNIETNYDDLAQKVSDTEATISENMKVYGITKRELKDLEVARTQASHKQWNNGLSEIGNYANAFSQWITEYSKDVLMKDIENYQKECKKVGEELAMLKVELNNMRTEYDSDYVEANVDANDLSNLNIVMADIKPSNNNLIHAVRLTQDTLNKIQNKIKQSEIAVNEYKTKERVNML